MAGPTCSICSRPDRAAIDRQLAADVPVRTLAKELGLPKSTLHLHKQRCCGLKAPTPEEKREPSRGTVALALLPSREEIGAQYATLGDRIDAIVQAAEKAGSLAIAVQGLNALRQNLDSLSKLAGHAGGSPHVSVDVQVNLSAADIAAELVQRLAGADARVIEGVLDD